MDLTTGKLCFAGSATMAKTYSDASATVAVSSLLTATYVKRSQFAANTIAIANASGTFTFLTAGVSTLLGRGASGSINDLSAANAWTILGGGASPIVIDTTIAVPTVATGTWAQVGGTYPNHTMYNTSTADGDAITYAFTCPAGTYTIDVTFGKLNSFGKFDLFVDASKHMSLIDAYDSSASVLVGTNQVTGKAITAGTHTVRVAINTKNGSSSDYALNLSKISFTRTGD